MRAITTELKRVVWKSWFAHFSVQGDEDTVPDKPQDMRPRNYSGKDNVNEPEDEEARETSNMLLGMGFAKLELERVC